MFAPLKYLCFIAATFLLVFGIFPVTVSAMYGGHPPDHVAKLLDKQMETFAKVAPIIFSPFNLHLGWGAKDGKSATNGD